MCDKGSGTLMQVTGAPSRELIYIGEKHMCGRELYCVDDGVSLLFFPPQKRVYCDCGYTSFVGMTVFNASKCYREQVKRG